MKFAMKLAFAACLMLVMGLQAQAAQAKSFVLLPFEVHAPQNYSYLSKAVPSTLMGRLSATGATGSMGPRAAGSAAEARKFIGGADYALWGTVSVMGNDCTIVLNSVDKKGATWSQTAQGPMSGLNATVQRLAGAFSSEVLCATKPPRSLGFRPRRPFGHHPQRDRPDRILPEPPVPLSGQLR